MDGIFTNLKKVARSQDLQCYSQSHHPHGQCYSQSCQPHGSQPFHDLTGTIPSSRSGGGGQGGHGPPGPVKIGHKKDGHQRQPHRFHVSQPPFTPPLDLLLIPLFHRSIPEAVNWGTVLGVVPASSFFGNSQ